MKNRQRQKAYRRFGYRTGSGMDIEIAEQYLDLEQKLGRYVRPLGLMRVQHFGNVWLFGSKPGRAEVRRPFDTTVIDEGPAPAMIAKYMEPTA